MQPLSDQALSDGLVPWIDFHGQSVKFLSGKNSGMEFSAVISIGEPFEFSGEVMKDMRERSVISFMNNSWPALAIAGDILVDWAGQEWTLGKRTSNPADQVVEFDITVKTKNDDQPLG